MLKGSIKGDPFPHMHAYVEYATTVCQNNIQFVI